MMDNHQIIFGCPEKEMDNLIKEDNSGWLESDYQFTRQLLVSLHRKNKDLSDLFVKNMQKLDGLNKLTIQHRIRFIYFLASQHIDWRDTNHQNVDLGDNGATTVLYPKVYSKEPTINIDFQHITNQISQFDPSSDQLEAWEDIFGNALKHHQVQPEVSSGIVRDAGKKRKRRQK